MSLDRIGDLATEYFSGSPNYCAYYYDAMFMVSDAVDVPIEAVIQNLAALVSWLILLPTDTAYAETNWPEPGLHRTTFCDAMILHLNAVKIYATYLWAWLHIRTTIQCIDFIGESFLSN